MATIRDVADNKHLALGTKMQREVFRTFGSFNQNASYNSMPKSGQRMDCEIADDHDDEDGPGASRVGDKGGKRTRPALSPLLIIKIKIINCPRKTRPCHLGTTVSKHVHIVSASASDANDMPPCSYSIGEKSPSYDWTGDLSPTCTPNIVDKF